MEHIFIKNKTFVKHESGLYVARDGEVWIPKSGKQPEHTTYGTNDSKGYLQVMYRGKHYKVHRLVAECYIPNPNNLPFINHKSEIKNDNRVENLEYCDAKYNTNYGTGIQRRVEKQSKPVAQYDLSGNLIAVFPSMMEVQRTLGYSREHICDCCRGKQKTAYKYKWKYT